MIAVVCPSRGRPVNAQRLINSVRLTEAGVDLFVCVDEDDPCLDGYRALDLDGVELIVGPALRFAGWLNKIAPMIAGDHDIVGWLGDDNICRSPHWDKALAEAMRPLGVVYGNDLFQGERLATAAFVDARIIRHLGWMAPPGIEHLYVDNTWMAIGKHLGTLTYLPDVVIEHAHPFAAKALMDPVYAAANSPERYEHDRAAFEVWRDERMAADLAGLAP